MTEKNKTISLCTLAIASLGLSMSITWISISEVKETTINISNQLSELHSEIQNQKISREEEYEKRFQEIRDKIAEIDKHFEEVQNESYTETIIFEEEIPESGKEECSKERLPVGVDTNRYDCEPHTFGYGTHQYWLQSACYTDELGLRYFLHNGKKYYCVAMGGAYGVDIGDIWDVTLECGTEFGIILSDYQHSIDPPDPNDFGEIYERDIYGNVVDILRNYDGEPVCHVLEFVVEIDKLNPYILGAGTVSAIKEFGGLYGDGGNIVDISYIGRAWSL